MENFMNISETAYAEFKQFLDASGVRDYNLRITYLGKKCSGLVFNISSDKKYAEDISVNVNDLCFIAAPALVEEYGGFKILSTEENGGEGLILKPVIEPVNNCNICPGC